MAGQSLNDAHREATRRRLESAARVVFADKGYSGATIADVVAEAAVSRGTLYLHFQTKEELLVAAAVDLDHESRSQMAQLGHILADGTKDDLLAWLERTIQWYQQHREMALALLEAELSNAIQSAHKSHQALLESCDEWTNLWPEHRRDEALTRLELCRAQFQLYVWGFEPTMPEFGDDLAPVLADIWWTTLRVPGRAER